MAKTTPLEPACYPCDFNLNHSGYDAVLGAGRQLADLPGVPMRTAGKRG